MAEDTKQTQQNQQTDEEPTAQQENTFTQEDVNKFLAKERRKWEREQAKAANTTAPAAQPGTAAEAAQSAADNSATAAVQRELISARAQLEAMRSGVRSDVAEDAVLLAIHEVERDGDEPTADTIREALKNVLKRHPDWKQEKKQGGIKVGAQPGEPDKDPAKTAYSGVTFF